MLTTTLKHFLVGIEFQYAASKTNETYNFDARRSKSEVAGEILGMYKSFEVVHTIDSTSAYPLTTKPLAFTLCSQAGPTPFKNHSFILCTKNNNHRVLYVTFCWGTSILESEYDVLWEQLLQNSFEECFRRHIVNEIVLTGHSMGAALTLLTTIRLLTRCWPQKVATNKLFVCMSGLGRVSTPILREFADLHKIHGFQVVDVFLCNGDGRFPDNRINRITISTIACNGIDDVDGTPFYCDNYEKCKNAGDDLAACGVHVKKNRLRQNRNPTEQVGTQNYKVDVYGNPLSDDELACASNDWGDLYSEKYNACLDLYDKYHRHNWIGTHVLTSDGNLIPIDKNRFTQDSDYRVSSDNDYHRIGKYVEYVKALVRKQDAKSDLRYS